MLQVNEIRRKLGLPPMTPEQEAEYLAVVERYIKAVEKDGGKEADSYKHLFPRGNA